VEELPAPVCPKGGILVRTAYSLISAGTEKTSVTSTKQPLLIRAKNQPEQVRALLDFVKKEGLRKAIDKVRNKLDSYKSLGYSASGIVVESDCDDFSPGDNVACAGAGFAVHAEYLAIPRNLAVRIPEGVDIADAAYTTVGTIALQGIRQAEVRLGETVAVIGLGLLGLITVQLLKASGCRVVGLDVSSISLENGLKYSCDLVYPSSSTSIDSINYFTRGLGCDKVIITASTSSNSPMELALKLSRKRGIVVIVGAIGMNLPRSPFYEKEIDIRISTSYGPGRYDTNYELRGADYPAAYVRWTERRNMEAILDMIAMSKLDVKSMSSHVFPIREASKAYDLITSGTEPFMGILLSYDANTGDIHHIMQHASNNSLKKLNIGFIGAGNFAQSSLLPNIKGNDISLIGVSTETAVNAVTAGKQFGFGYSSTDSESIIADEKVNTVFISTRHDSHAGFVLAAIKNKKPVFVEKPLCINKQQLEEIDDAMNKNQGRVMVGFNRRFSAPFRAIADFYKNRTEPMIINYRVNAGFINASHWLYTAENGGRIIGEVCHFIDCMVYLTQSLPVRVYAEAISSENPTNPNHSNVNISLKFTDGSIGTVSYCSNGDKSLAKEYCEVFSEQSTAIMNNFKTVELYRAGNVRKLKFDGSKGHKEEVEAFLNAARTGDKMPISYPAIKAITLATFAAEESILTAMPVEMTIGGIWKSF
jgi:polar amino acid transport system substrate-binding protein